MNEPTRRAALLLLCLLTSAFDWPTSTARHQREMQRGSATEKQDWLPQLVKASSEEATELLLRALENRNPAVRTAAANQLYGETLRLAVPILIDLTRRDSVPVQIAAARALGRSTYPERCVPALLPMLESKLPELRATAADALGELALAAALPLALPALLTHLHDGALPVRIAVAVALQSFPADAVTTPLQQALFKAPALLQQAIVGALAELGATSAVSAIAIFATSEDEETALSAVLGLGRIGGERAETTLHTLLPNNSSRVAKATLTALAGFPTPTTTRILLEHLGHPQLGEYSANALRHAALLSSTTEDTRYATALAAALMSRLRDAATSPNLRPQEILGAAKLLSTLSNLDIHQTDVSLLIKLYKRAPSASMVDVLAATDSAQTIPTLMTATADPSPEKRRAGRRGLLKLLNNHSAGAAVAKTLNAQLTTIKIPAEQAELVELVALTGRTEALPALFALINSPHEAVLLATLRALGDVGNDATCNRLITLLSHQDRARGQAATVAIGRCAGPLTLDALVALLESKHPHRERVLDAIAATARREKTPLPNPLAKTLQARLQVLAFGGDEATAIAAIHALAEMPTAFALPILGKLLRQPTDRRRAEAAAVLGRFAPNATRPLLRYLLRQASPGIVLGALSGIAEVGDERDLASIMKLSSSEHWPLPSMVPYVLSRWLVRDVITARTAQRALCELLARPEPTLRANAAAALAHTGAGDCPKQDISPNDLLSLNRGTSERISGAHWLRSAIDHGRMPMSQAQVQLQRCLLRDPSPLVRKACARPSSNGSTSKKLESPKARPSLHVSNRDGTALAKHRVAIHFDDGTSLITLTDGQGTVHPPLGIRNIERISDPGLLPHRPF